MTNYILVTGGAGFIGQHLVHQLAGNLNHHIVAVDNRSGLSPLPNWNQGNVQFIEGDVNDSDMVSHLFEEFSFSYIFHYAAITGVEKTLENPLLVLRDLDGIRLLVEASLNTPLKRFIYSSSSEVYGESISFPQEESRTPLNSRLPYALVKTMGEAIIRSHGEVNGLPYTLFRFFNTYGPGQRTDFVVPRLIQQALTGEDLTLLGDGNQSRTFCTVNDNVDTTIKAMDHPDTLNTVMNVGSSRETTMLELAQKILDVTQSSSNIIHLPARQEGDMQRRVPDNQRMKNILGRELQSLEEGLLELAEHWKTNNSLNFLV